MWHELFILGPYRLAWSVKHPNGTIFSRGTHAEAVETAHELSTAMRKYGIEHYRCRVYKTYVRAA